MTVRAATVEDAAAAADLLAALGYETDGEELGDGLAWFAASEDDAVLVDDRDGDVVGLVVVHRTRTLIDPSLFGRVTALSVAPAWQRAGVGAALLSAAEAWLAERGVGLVQVNCGRRPERDAAHRFYPSMGYRDQHDHHVLYEKHLAAT